MPGRLTLVSAPSPASSSSACFTASRGTKMTQRSHPANRATHRAPGLRRLAVHSACDSPNAAVLPRSRAALRMFFCRHWNARLVFSASRRALARRPASTFLASSSLRACSSAAMRRCSSAFRNSDKEEASKRRTRSCSMRAVKRLGSLGPWVNFLQST